MLLPIQLLLQLMILLPLVCDFHDPYNFSDSSDLYFIIWTIIYDIIETDLIYYT